ncbi:ribonuclease H-like domain-containing protein [Tanacetum coccineum]
MSGSQDEIPPPPPPPSSQTPTQQTPHTVSTIKLPILKKGEYDIWAMKMEHNLAHTDYPIWEVIQNGNGPVSITTDTQGQIKVLPPRTAEEILARERERKTRTILLMALPEDHLAKFHKMTDAKEMWDAIKSRFSGNDKSKKMQKYILKQQFEGIFVSNSEGLHKRYDRFQSLLSQLEVHGAGVSTEDANQKFLRSLPSAWSQVSLIMRTKPGVDSLSFDDLYNNLRVFENDVKGSTASSSSTQNVAFVSENTSSTNDVSTAYSVSNTSGQNSQYEQTSSYSLLANQSSCPQLDHEDLEQLDEFDLEEMDLKWQVAMISMRMKKFYKKTGRKLQFDAKEPVGFDKTKVECYNCHKTGHFARECRTKGNQDSRRRDAWNSGNKDGRRSGKQEDSKALVTIDGEGVDWTSHSEEEEDYALMACNSSGSDTEVTSCSNECKESYAKLKKLYDAQREQLSDASIEIKAYTQGLKKVEAQLVAHQQGQLWFVTAEGMHAVPPPMTGNYMPSGLDEYASDSEDEHVSLPTEEQETPSFANQQVKTPRETVKNQFTNSKNPKVDKKGLGYGFVTKAFSTARASGTNNVSTARHNFNKQAVPTNVAMKVNTVKPLVNRVNTAEVNAVSAVGGRRETVVKPSAGKPCKGLPSKDVSNDPTLFDCLKGKDVLNLWVKRISGISNARTPQQNGVAERKNRTLIEAARTMLADSFLPNTFWAEAVSTTCYVLNRVLVTKPHNKTPYELVTGPQEANHNAGTKDIIDAGDSKNEAESAQDYFVLPIWSSYSLTVKRSTANDTGEAPNKHPDLKTDEKPVDKEDQVFLDELERLKRQEQVANDAVEALRKDTASPYGGLSFTNLTNPDQDDSEIPPLEEIYANPTDGIFINSSYDDEGAVADFTNLEPVINVYRNKKDERGVVVRNKARIEAIRIFLAFTSYMRFIVYQMDVKSAFLYGKIDEEVYVSQPPGFVDPKYPKKVSKVVKALYGLHQAPRAWTTDIILVQVYVDDIIFGSTKKSWCDEFEALMKSRFQMSSMGELTFFLGLQTASTPIETQKPLVKDEKASNVDFVLVLECPHLTWKPTQIVTMLEQIFEGKSTQGMSNFLAGGTYSAGIHKADNCGGGTSNTKAEDVVAVNCCGQVLWIQNQMLDYGFNFMNTKIYIDNESTICIIKNPVYHSKTKHIAIRHHFIRDAYKKKLIQVLKIHTDDNVADLLTKAFDVSRFQFLLLLLG